ncbi:MAG: hypothetical protein KBG15_17250, partial [Kofleriaceae bacterium]|nr:hypothetical protein [Kofleriaceae bacterium]
RSARRALDRDLKALPRRSNVDWAQHDAPSRASYNIAGRTAVTLDFVRRPDDSLGPITSL